MTARNVTLPCLALAMLLAGCAVEQAPSAATAPLFDGDGRIGWRGVLPCADCEGIDTVLTLDHQRGRRGYLLVETYLTGDDGERFVEHGRWRQDDRLVRLQASDGGERIYALQADGRLQLRDGERQASAPRPGDYLSPISMEPSR